MYYVAVGGAKQKLPTLVDLLHALGKQEAQLLTLVIANSRDTLDVLVAKFEHAFYLHSDMNAQERKAVLDEWTNAGTSATTTTTTTTTTTATATASCSSTTQQQKDEKDEKDEDGPNPNQRALWRRMLVSTHVCLPPWLDQPAPLLINYDIPMTKEQHLKRTGCVKDNGTVINFVSANEVSLLKSLENFSSRKVEELPLDLSGIIQE